jgi:hypothetical protein
MNFLMAVGVTADLLLLESYRGLIFTSQLRARKKIEWRCGVCDIVVTLCDLYLFQCNGVGEAPITPADIHEIFAKYVEHRIPIIPWCEAPLQPETSVITTPLAAINRAGKSMSLDIVSLLVVMSIHKILRLIANDNEELRRIYGLKESTHISNIFIVT